jgi:hypothetical protein
MRSTVSTWATGRLSPTEKGRHRYRGNYGKPFLREDRAFVLMQGTAIIHCKVNDPENTNCALKIGNGPRTLSPSAKTLSFIAEQAGGDAG